MAYVERHIVAITTNGSGVGEGYTPVVTGRVAQIHYVKDSFDNGVDVTVTSEATGQTIWAENDVNASAVRAPRQATHSTAGAAALYAAGGAAVLAPIALAKDRVKIAVAQGGAAKAGTFHVVIE